MLTTADVNIHALIAKYGIDIQIVRPEMTKFKLFRVKVNMDVALPRHKFVTGATLLQLDIRVVNKQETCLQIMMFCT
jgi:hypothetical protein